MEFSREKYDLTKEKHCEELRNLLLKQGSDNENQIVDIDDENSDTDASACVEEQEENSDSEQSDLFASKEDIEENATYFIAVQKRRNVVVNERKWQKFPLPQRRRKPTQNILMHLPGVVGDAKQANGIYETWNILIDDKMLGNIVECTNKYIQSIKVNFGRPRDAKIPDIVEIRAVIGLLYLAGVYHANGLSLDELWSEDHDFEDISFYNALFEV
ncbi:hypothetical protein JTB14_032008 [Gonioctena quinquepunctata]|nr:hypothetical protein JTB14_032008 [Gonioctena quinquepunctata]